MIILPQCVKRMTPPWMNLYAILTVATPLTSVVGVSEAMTLTGESSPPRRAPSCSSRSISICCCGSSLYCYPIARATLALEETFPGEATVMV